MQTWDEAVVCCRCSCTVAMQGELHRDAITGKPYCYGCWQASLVTPSRQAPRECVSCAGTDPPRGWIRLTEDAEVGVLTFCCHACLLNYVADALAPDGALF